MLVGADERQRLPVKRKQGGIVEFDHRQRSSGLFGIGAGVVSIVAVTVAQYEQGEALSEQIVERDVVQPAVRRKAAGDRRRNVVA